MYRRIFTIYDNNRTFGKSEQIFSFGINKNGSPENMEHDILNILKDMDKHKLININKLFTMLNYEYSKISISNIKENIKPLIINISDNLELIKEKL